jgi:hypothetical protein
MNKHKRNPYVTLTHPDSDLIKETTTTVFFPFVVLNSS